MMRRWMNDRLWKEELPIGLSIDKSEDSDIIEKGTEKQA